MSGLSLAEDDAPRNLLIFGMGQSGYELGLRAIEVEQNFLIGSHL
jgi:hypothetical protein